jgi:hypothetical protein
MLVSVRYLVKVLARKVDKVVRYFVFYLSHSGQISG